MENNIKGILTVAEDVADVVHRVSCLCDMLSYLSDTTSEIPESSLCGAMGLLRNILEEQANTLYSLRFADRKMPVA